MKRPENRAFLAFSHAFLITCTPALLIAGLIGILGARWMAAAERANHEEPATTV